MVFDETDNLGQVNERMGLQTAGLDQPLCAATLTAACDCRRVGFGQRSSGTSLERCYHVRVGIVITSAVGDGCG